MDKYLLINACIHLYYGKKDCQHYSTSINSVNVISISETKECVYVTFEHAELTWNVAIKKPCSIRLLNKERKIDYEYN